MEIWNHNLRGFREEIYYFGEIFWKNPRDFLGYTILCFCFVCYFLVCFCSNLDALFLMVSCSCVVYH